MPSTQSTGRPSMPDAAALPALAPALAAASPRAPCEVRDLGRCGYSRAFDLQRELVAARKLGAVCDQLVFVEHPPTITLGRNADSGNVLAAPRYLREMGVSVEETDRGGDVTYHGPGQVVAYPIIDLKGWRRDVGAYMRGLEQVIIETVAEFGVRSWREAGLTGVWTDRGKLAALGVHLSRWVTSHGLALNVSTNLSHFRLIVPCGLAKPVTSMSEILGAGPRREDVIAAMCRRFAEVFERTMRTPGGAAGASQYQV